MAYNADPGGIFESDTHRRVLAHLPLPGDDPIALYDPYAERPTKVSLFHRMIADVGTDFADENELLEVLYDLQSAGYAGETKVGWKQTKKGHDALNAPVPEKEVI